MVVTRAIERAELCSGIGQEKRPDLGSLVPLGVAELLLGQSRRFGIVCAHEQVHGCVDIRRHGFQGVRGGRQRVKPTGHRTCYGATKGKTLRRDAVAILRSVAIFEIVEFIQRAGGDGGFFIDRRVTCGRGWQRRQGGEARSRRFVRFDPQQRREFGPVPLGNDPIALRHVKRGDAEQRDLLHQRRILKRRRLRHEVLARTGYGSVTQVIVSAPLLRRAAENTSLAIGIIDEGGHVVGSDVQRTTGSQPTRILAAISPYEARRRPNLVEQTIGIRGRAVADDMPGAKTGTVDRPEHFASQAAVRGPHPVQTERLLRGGIRPMDPRYRLQVQRSGPGRERSADPEGGAIRGAVRGRPRLEHRVDVAGRVRLA